MRIVAGMPETWPLVIKRPFSEGLKGSSLIFSVSFLGFSPLSGLSSLVLLACGISGTVGDEGCCCGEEFLSSVGLLGSPWKCALSVGNESSVLLCDTAHVLPASIS